MRTGHVAMWGSRCATLPTSSPLIIPKPRAPGDDQPRVDLIRHPGDLVRGTARVGGRDDLQLGVDAGRDQRRDIGADRSLHLTLVDPARHTAHDRSDHHLPHVHDRDRRAQRERELLRDGERVLRLRRAVERENDSLDHDPPPGSATGVPSGTTTSLRRVGAPRM